MADERDSILWLYDISPEMPTRRPGRITVCPAHLPSGVRVSCDVTMHNPRFGNLISLWTDGLIRNPVPPAHHVVIGAAAQKHEKKCALM